MNSGEKKYNCLSVASKKKLLKKSYGVRVDRHETKNSIEYVNEIHKGNGIEARYKKCKALPYERYRGYKTLLTG